MDALQSFLKIFFVIALAIFALELVRDSTGVATILNAFSSSLDTGYRLESQAGGGQFRKGQ